MAKKDNELIITQILQLLRVRIPVFKQFKPLVIIFDFWSVMLIFFTKISFKILQKSKLSVIYFYNKLNKEIWYEIDKSLAVYFNLKFYNKYDKIPPTFLLDFQQK